MPFLFSPFSTDWILLQSTNQLLLSQVIIDYFKPLSAFDCGFSPAVVLLVLHVYISEIASPEIRVGHVGLLVTVSFSLGAYLD